MAATSARRSRMRFGALALGVGGLTVIAVAAAQATMLRPQHLGWTKTGGLTTARLLATADVLPDGRVLVAGGQGAHSHTLNSAELYDPSTGVWTVTGSMKTHRYGAASAELSDGNVLVVGGYGSGAFHGTAELYDASTGTWSPAGTVGLPRSYPTATRLEDGQVLVAGGDDDGTILQSAALYDPDTGTWTATGTMGTARYQGKATLLDDGDVLVAGGLNSSGVPTKTAQLYHPDTGTWSATGSMHSARDATTATLLADGRVLVAGGSSATKRLATAELYDPTSGTWSTTGSMSVARTAPVAARLSNGEVLLAGGAATSTTVVSSAELYDPTSGTWSPTTSMSTARWKAAVATLPSGDVLVVGGSDGTNVLGTAEYYSGSHPVGPLDHLVVNPASATTAGGTYVTYQVEGYDQSGNDVGDVTDAATLSIAPNGSCVAAQCTATTVGTHTVTATDGTAKGTASLVTTAPCTTFWSGPTSGTSDWNGQASYWSDDAFPTGSDVACITAPGTYTIRLSGGANVEGLQIGGEQLTFGGGDAHATVVVDASVGASYLGISDASSIKAGSQLTLAPSSSGTASLYDNSGTGAGSVRIESGGTFATTGAANSMTASISAPVVNQAGGTISIAAPDTQVPSSGSVSNSADLDVAAGTTLAVEGGTFHSIDGTLTGSPVFVDSGTLDDSGGTGTFTFRSSGGNLVGIVPTGQTVNTDATAGAAWINLSDDVTVDGTVTLTPSSLGSAYLYDNTGAGDHVLTVESGGTFSTTGAADSLTASIYAPVVNEAGGTISIAAPDTEVTSSGSVANRGDVDVAADGFFGVEGGTFSSLDGALTGNPVYIDSGTLDDLGGTGTFTFRSSGGKLQGTIPTGQTVNTDATAAAAWINLSDDVTVDGTLTLTPTKDYLAYLYDTTGAGHNAVTVESGGTFSTTGAAGSHTASIQAPVVNQTGGAISIAAPDTEVTNDGSIANGGSLAVVGNGALGLESGASSNVGTVSVASTNGFTVYGGRFSSLGGALTGNPIVIYGGTLDDLGGTGTFTFRSSGGNLEGTIPAGQTVNTDATAGAAYIHLVDNVTVNGTLSMKPTKNYRAYLDDTNGTGHKALIVASGGTFSTSGATLSLSASIQAPIVNQAGTISIAAPDTEVSAPGSITNRGLLLFVGNGALGLESGDSSNQGVVSVGSVGAFTVYGGTFSSLGGAITSNPIVISGAVLEDGGGVGAFTFSSSGGYLEGTIPTGQTVNTDATAGAAYINLADNVTVNGTLTLTPSASYRAYLYDASGSGNDALTVASGGTFSTTGAAASQTALIEAPLVNQTGGTITIAAPDTEVTALGSIANRGSLSVTSTGGFGLESGDSSNQGAVSVASAGGFTVDGGTFASLGGTLTGNPVVVDGAALSDSGGTGTFTFRSSGGSLQGTIPTGQTVNTDATAGAAYINLADDVTVNGTLTLKPTKNYGVYLNDSTGGHNVVTVASGGTFSTTGAAGSQPASIQAPVVNAAGGTITIDAPHTQLGSGGSIANSGTAAVTNRGALAVAGGKFTNQTTGTLGVTVNVASGLGGVSGPGVKLGGTLAVTTTGTPSVGSTFTPITGSTGTFSAVTSGAFTYTVAYSSGSVTLTRA